MDATVKTYGAFVEVSDLFSMTAQDPVLDDSVELLGEQIGTTMDWVSRDALIADASGQFAGAATSLLTVASTMKLTIAEVREAVATLKMAKARPFNDGGRDYFICIVDPYSVYDLQSDSLWQDTAKYADTERLFTGELGRIMGVRFIESTEGYISKQSVRNAVKRWNHDQCGLRAEERPDRRGDCVPVCWREQNQDRRESVRRGGVHAPRDHAAFRFRRHLHGQTDYDPRPLRQITSCSPRMRAFATLRPVRLCRYITR